MRVPGPDGEFILVDLINPGICPECGAWSKKMWYYVPNAGKDKFKKVTKIVIGCEECGSKGTV